MKHKLFLIVTIILILFEVESIVLIELLLFYFGLNVVEVIAYFKKRKNG